LEEENMNIRNSAHEFIQALRSLDLAERFSTAGHRVFVEDTKLRGNEFNGGGVYEPNSSRIVSYLSEESDGRLENRSRNTNDAVH
jgi:cephalosporin hydroxylase